MTIRSDHAELLKRVGTDTTMVRAGLMLRNALVNHRRLANLPHITTTSIRGGVIVVGAGPTAAEGLKVLAKTVWNPVVIAVNGTWRLCEQYGLPADMVVSMESMDTSEQLAGYSGPVALDWTSHPRAFKAAGKRARWFTDASPYSSKYITDAGLRPLDTGCSAITAGIEIALECGADAITLVGVDSCYPRGKGLAYERGTPWGGMGVKRKGSRLIFQKNDKRDAMHDAHGIPRIPLDRPRLIVNGMDTVPEMLSQAEWIRERASRASISTMSKSFRRLLGDDSELSAFCQTTGSGTIDSPSWPTHPRITREAILRECDLAEDLAAHFLDGGAFPADAAIHGLPIISTLVAPDMMRVRRDPAASRTAKLFAPYEFLRAGAKQARRLLGKQEVK